MRGQLPPRPHPPPRLGGGPAPPSPRQGGAVPFSNQACWAWGATFWWLVALQPGPRYIGWSKQQLLTESFAGLRELQGEGASSGQLLKQPGHLVVPTAQQALPVDGLDHVAHVNELDVVNDAALLDALRREELSVLWLRPQTYGHPPPPAPPTPHTHPSDTLMKA